MSRDVVMMNGISLISMISTSSVMLPFLSKMLSGRKFHEFIITHRGIFLAVFRFKDSRLGPGMSSALMMSSFVIG